MSRDTYIYTYTVPEEGKKHVGGPWCDTSKWLKAEGYLYESGMETNFNNQEFSDKYGNLILVGGLEHFLLSIIYGRILPIDFHIFQRGRSTTNQYRIQHRIPATKGLFLCLQMNSLEMMGKPDFSSMEPFNHRASHGSL